MIVDIPNEYFEANRKQAEKEWDLVGAGQKGKGMRFEFDVEVNGIEVEDDDITISGGTIDENPWVRIDWKPDAYDLKSLIEYTTKQLNRFKAALESIVGLT